MADVLKNLFGGAKTTEKPATTADSDFADFAGAADTTSVPFTPPVKGGANLGLNSPLPTGRPYTKWYRLDERYTLKDFQIEGVILVFIVLMVVIHLIGARLNRSKARSWIKAHAATLASEFSLVGFGSVPQNAPGSDATAGDTEGLLKENSLFEFTTYATGRQNVAFLDVKLTLIRRFNPLMTLIETGLALGMDMFPMPGDKLEAVIYPFDGKESQIVPGPPGSAELRTKDSKSAYDGFVWAIVNKDRMKGVRDDRYDVSLTFTKDSSKLPAWLTVMSESAEITDALLTPELCKAVVDAGDLFDYLIVSDQPMDKPKTLDDMSSRKRIFLKYRLPSDNKYESLAPLFAYFVRLPDLLAKDAHYRPEVLRKIKSIREEAVKEIQRADETEKNEERTLEREKQRKAKRDQELSALDAKGQKKYLEKEREKEMRKAMKKQSVRS